MSPMTEADVPSLARLESLSSQNPWNAAQIAEELEKPSSRFFVVRAPEVGSPASAFGGFWLVAGEAQLAELAVAPDKRRRGLGRALLWRLFREAAVSGASRMTLEVRAGNAAALALYAAEGFRETSRRPRFYDGKEDAVLMEKSL